MKKLYEKNELHFALAWIAVYVVLCSVGDNVSAAIGVTKLVTAPICILLTVLAYGWIRKHGLKEKYGLVPFQGSAKNYLYFIPLVLVCTTNVWFGVRLNMTVAESALYAVTMLCTGFLEEVIFRGFLFKAMSKDHLKSAIVVSSLTFGLGHIVNLLNGRATVGTLLQMCYAFALGFLFVILFYKTKTLWPCIFTHSAINVLSTFSNRTSATLAIDLAASAFLCIVPLLYVWFILKHTGNKCETKS